MDDSLMAFTYFTNAAIFKNAADTLAEHIELDDEGRPAKLTAIPYYFLSSQSAELQLKAILLLTGRSQKELKTHKYRHNLDELLSLVSSLEIEISDDSKKCIKGLSLQHKNHSLRYDALAQPNPKLYWPPLTNIETMQAELENVFKSNLSNIANPEPVQSA